MRNAKIHPPSRIKRHRMQRTGPRTRRTSLLMNAPRRHRTTIAARPTRHLAIELTGHRTIQRNVTGVGDGANDRRPPAVPNL